MELKPIGIPSQLFFEVPPSFRVLHVPGTGLWCFNDQRKPERFRGTPEIIGRYAGVSTSGIQKTDG